MNGLLLAAGGTIGAGIALLVRGLAPPRPRLADTIAALRHPAPPPSGAADSTMSTGPFDTASHDTTPHDTATHDPGCRARGGLHGWDDRQPAISPGPACPPPAPAPTWTCWDAPPRRIWPSKPRPPSSAPSCPPP